MEFFFINFCIFGIHVITQVYQYFPQVCLEWCCTTPLFQPFPLMWYKNTTNPKKLNLSYFCCSWENLEYKRNLLLLGYIHVRRCVHVHNSHTLYRITGYLCNSEICAFWPKKAILNVCNFIYIYTQLYMGCGYPMVDNK